MLSELIKRICKHKITFQLYLKNNNYLAQYTLFENYVKNYIKKYQKYIDN